MKRRFEGAVAIVTGSSRGIGRATATQLLREGASVVVNARKQDDLDATIRDLEQLGDVVGVAANLSHEDAPARLVEAATNTFGRLDHLVNTVGVNVHHGLTMEIDERAFSRIMTMNTWSVVAMTQAAVAGGLTEGGGSVVNISTIGAQQVHPMLGAYCASKAALDSLTMTIARELGPRGVRVNGVAPGLVRTDMARVLWEDGRGDAEAEILPLQRIGEPEDIARAVTFLLSEDAEWLTGVTIAVDGGRLLVGGEPREEIGVYTGIDR